MRAGFVFLFGNSYRSCNKVKMAEVQTSLIRYRSAIVAQIRFAVLAVVFDFAVHDF